MSKRPILLGQNNPLSSRPEHALFPHPPGCTGHRLLELLRKRLPEVTRQQYLAAFDRRNLICGRDWNNGDARIAAAALVAELRHGERTVLALGEAVRLALDLPRRLLHPIRRDGVTWRLLPHPSGRNRWYNEEFSRDVVSLILEEMYEESTR